MTWNAAFPSSPLSRSAIRGDTSPSMRSSSTPMFNLPGEQSRLGAAPPDPPHCHSGWRDDAAMPSSPFSSPRASPHKQSPRPSMPSLASSPPSPRMPFRSSSRRLSSHLSTSPNPSNLPLVGSYSESLLNGRMSTTPSVPFPFEAEIGALGCTSGQSQTPKHLKIDFEARFYPLPEATTGQQSPSGGSTRSFSSSYVAQSSMPSPTPPAAAGPTMSAATTQAPYVGTINLESHYSSVLASCLDPSSSQQAAPPAVPVFPGYAVPRRGQIQLLIKNPHLNVPFKLFLVPYDLSDMPAGSKTFLRQKICLEAGSEASSFPSMTTGRAKRHSLGATTSLLRSEAKPKEMLRYAVHLQFASPPLKPASKKQQSAKQAAASAQILESSSWQAGPEQEEPKLYLHKSIRVVFSPRAPDREEKVKTTYETPAGLCVPELPAQDPKECARMREKKYAPYSGPSAEWEGQRKRARLARREWKRRRQSEASERDREQGDESVGSFADQSDISTASSVPATEGYGRFEPAGEAVEAAAMAMDIDVEPDVQAQANVFEPNSDPNGERWHGSQAIGVDEAEDVAGTGTLADRWGSLTLASHAEPGATSTPGWPLRGHRHTLQRQRSRTITPATQANAEG
ncbi:hypothetical protein BDZ90DRAFT_274970, partial [Jaminaea rosea]